MAKKERQKRSARKARAAERAQREATYVENAVARGEDPEKAKEQFAKANAEKSVKPKVDKNKKPNIFQRIGNWFSGVFKEMRLVVWPTPRELRNYSFAVVGLLIAFGLVVWAVDTGITAVLVQYVKLRPDAPQTTQVVDSEIASEVPVTALTSAEPETAAEAATPAESDSAATESSEAAAEQPATESVAESTGSEG